ncbi:hypothetical protein K438DRAFT_1863845, partial [Mycena galopus ATCC 62051]
SIAGQSQHATLHSSHKECLNRRKRHKNGKAVARQRSLGRRFLQTLMRSFDISMAKDRWRLWTSGLQCVRAQ